MAMPFLLCASAQALCSAGCKSPPTDTVIDKAVSADGRYVAVLSERDVHAALTANVFYLIVIPARQDFNETIRANDNWDKAPLIATWAKAVRLRWRDDRTLLVVCDSCGLRPIDIIAKRDRDGPVTILYQGFPEHTASD